MLSEQEMQDWLQDCIQTYLEEVEQSDAVRVQTFEDAALLTYNKGLVVRFEEGGEFQLTIVRSA